MKTIRMTFELDIDSLEAAHVILRDGKMALSRRRLKYQEIDNGLVVIKSDPGWAKSMSDTGHSGYNENALFDSAPEGMKLTNITVIYTHARIPSSVRPGKFCQYNWMNGQHPFYGKGLHSIVTCLPFAETVSISMDVNDSCREVRDKYRRGYLEIRWSVENRIKLAKSAVRLAKALEANPPNAGRIQRFKNELLLTIARLT